MKQAVMTEPGKIEYHRVPKPEIRPGHVVVRISRIGVCGSDIHVWHGLHPYTDYPVVQGHEVSGVVESVGDGVTGLSAGNKVTIQPQVTCGTCYPCTHGKYHICDNLKVMGFQTTGTASEYFLVEAEKVLRLPDDINMNHGAMVEPLAVACHALFRVGEVSGLNVLVLGAGPIGNLTAQAAMGKGAV
jgi:L-iditol 2-dehydrogenase